MKIEFRGTTYNMTSNSCQVLEKCVPFVKTDRNVEQCYEPFYKYSNYKLYWRGSKLNGLKIYDSYKITKNNI